MNLDYIKASVKQETHSIYLNGIKVFSGTKLGAAFFLAHHHNAGRYEVRSMSDMSVDGRAFLGLGGAS